MHPIVEAYIRAYTARFPLSNLWERSPDMFLDLFGNGGVFAVLLVLLLLQVCLAMKDFFQFANEA